MTDTIQFTPSEGHSFSTDISDGSRVTVMQNEDGWLIGLEVPESDPLALTFTHEQMAGIINMWGMSAFAGAHPDECEGGIPPIDVMIRLADPELGGSPASQEEGDLCQTQ